MHSFLEKDIHEHIHELPVVHLGFEPDDVEDADDSSIRLSTLEEMTSGERTMHNNRVVDEASKIDDYHTALNHIHKNFVHSDYMSEHDKLSSSLIYDVLKKGKPNSNDVDLIATHSNYLSAPESDHKYRQFIAEKVAKHHLDFDTPEKAIMTADEINSVPVQWTHAGLRVFNHPNSTLYAEHHPVHGLQLIHHPDMHRINKVFDSLETVNKTYKEHDDLKAITPTPNTESFRKYTDESAPVNRYLALTHRGDIEPDDNNTVLGEYKEHIRDHIRNLDSEFESAHTNISHGKPLSVYTGVYAEHNVNTQPKRDEKGNIYFHNPSYTSTSLDVTTADGFAKLKTRASNDGVIHRGVREIVSLHVPEWYPHARYIGGTSHHDSERELLLNRGQTFKIHPEPLYMPMTSRAGSTRIWSGTVVPHDTQKELSFHEKSHVNKIIHMMTDPTFDKDTLWDVANNHVNAGVRSAAAYHPNFPTERVTDFTDHTHDVRTSLLARKHTPSHLIDAAIKNENVSDLRTIARRANLHPQHFQKLFDTQYSTVHAELCHRSDLNEHQVNKLYDAGQTDLHILRNIAAHPGIGQSRFEELSRHPDKEVRIGVARNLATPHKLLREMYSNEHHHTVNQAILTSPNYWNFKETK